MAASKTLSVLGRTRLPEEDLLHKWIIDDASILFSENVDAKIRSETFYAGYPSSLTIPPHLESSWSLLIEKGDETEISISLCQGNEDEPVNSRRPEILISKCIFSLMNPKTCKVEFSTMVTTENCVLCEPLQKCIAEPIEHKQVKKCLFNGALTVQVSATILYINGTVNPVCEVPLDNIRKEMYSLYKDEVLTDTIIKCVGKEFKVHKVILASQSPVFMKMFEVDMNEKRTGVIELLDTTPAVVLDMVTYLYTGTTPNVSSLAKHCQQV